MAKLNEEIFSKKHIIIVTKHCVWEWLKMILEWIIRTLPVLIIRKKSAKN